jgi:uncharacterized protein YodC (DUF2158 family)
MNSSLNPYINKELPVFVRLTASPVYSLANTNSSFPDGVIVYGDVVNGKIGDHDMIVSTYTSGYSGAYWYNEISDTFHLLSSVYKAPGSSEINIDVHLPAADSAVRKAMNSGEQSTFETVFRGNSFELTADSFEAAYSYNFEYNVQPEENVDYNPPLYVVRASSNDKWNVLRKQQTVIQVMTVLVQFISSVGISFLLYRPVHRFITALTHEMNHKGTRGKKKLEETNGCHESIQQFFEKCQISRIRAPSDIRRKSAASSVRDTELPPAQ